MSVCSGGEWSKLAPYPAGVSLAARFPIGARRPPGIARLMPRQALTRNSRPIMGLLGSVATR
jgi:hypothetical protein